MTDWQNMTLWRFLRMCWRGLWCRHYLTEITFGKASYGGFCKKCGNYVMRWKGYDYE